MIDYMEARVEGSLRPSYGSDGINRVPINCLRGVFCSTYAFFSGSPHDVLTFSVITTPGFILFTRICNYIKIIQHYIIFLF